MSKSNGKNGKNGNDDQSAEAAESEAVLHEFEAIEGFVRRNGLPREADELHVISERVRVALAASPSSPSCEEAPGSTDKRVISLEDARRVLEAIRRERDDGPGQDMQRALA